MQVRLIRWKRTVALVTLITSLYLYMTNNWIYIATGASAKWPATYQHRHRYNITSFVYTPDCNKLMAGDQIEIKRAKEMMFTEVRRTETDEDLIDSAKDCDEFVSQRGYRMKAASAEEAEYPIAFILTVHRNSEQVERLLRTTYDPQNVYCIHMDTKASLSFQQAITQIVQCFPNMFFVSKPLDVVYGGFSRLMADIHCMEDLLNITRPWHYVVNMCGQEMPLMTSLEMVRALKSLEGKNDIAGVVSNDANIIRRYTQPHKEGDDHPVASNMKKKPPPGNVTILHGSAYNMFTREFVNYVIKDPFALALREWFQDTYSPDEHYWPTLQFHEGTPGGKKTPSWSSIARAIKWQHMAPARYPHCQGYYQRMVCVYGVGDLQWLSQKPVLIANKFDIDADHLAIQCLHSWLDAKSHREGSHGHTQLTSSTNINILTSILHKKGHGDQ